MNSVEIIKNKTICRFWLFYIVSLLECSGIENGNMSGQVEECRTKLIRCREILGNAEAFLEKVRKKEEINYEKIDEIGRKIEAVRFNISDIREMLLSLFIKNFLLAEIPEITDFWTNADIFGIDIIVIDSEFLQIDVKIKKIVLALFIESDFFIKSYYDSFLSQHFEVKNFKDKSSLQLARMRNTFNGMLNGNESLLLVQALLKKLLIDFSTLIEKIKNKNILVNLQLKTREDIVNFLEKEICNFQLFFLR